jgi:hypothetical protein
VLFSGGGSLATAWGDSAHGDIPLVADINGDRRADFMVYRPGSPSTWFIRVTGGTPFTLQWGDNAFGDIPIVSDFNGDGRADIGVRRPEDAGTAPDDNHFIIRLSTLGSLAFRWGTVEDFYVPGDVNGDSAADFTVVRTLGNGDLRWFIATTAGTFAAVDWGNANTVGGIGDSPVAADYDADGTLDIAVWRPTTPRATFWIRRTANGAVTVLEFGDGAQDEATVFAGHCLQNSNAEFTAGVDPPCGVGAPGE